VKYLKLAVLITLTSCGAYAEAKSDKIEIKSGVNTSYCVPFDDPRCRSYNTQENSRLHERQQMERRIEKLERERELDRIRQPSREEYRDRRNY